jgi:hypothetical protein
VLFKQRLWAGLRDGSITVTYRRWKRSQAVVGHRYRTGGGLLEVDAVEVVADTALTDDEARRAGYRDRETLVRELDRYPDGDLYRIVFHHVGDDPRLALREDAALTDADHEAIAARLARLDRSSPRGAWTRAALEAIAAHPEVRAGDLATSLGRDRASFKLDVRKLKELGLTESLAVGYRLSPRGRAVLGRLPPA